MTHSQFESNDDVLIRELLNDESIPEVVKDRIVRNGMVHAQSQWSEMERQRRCVQQSREASIPRIEIHRTVDGVINYRSVSLLSENAERAERRRRA